MGINTTFYSLEPEKRERIMNAAMEEFERNGFAKASTNTMVKEAGISKGSLFHYFHNKKDLYLFLFEYVMEITSEVFEKINWEQTDIFERMREVTLLKFEIIHSFPQAFNFLKTVIEEDAAEVSKEIAAKMALFTESAFSRVYENIDYSKFRNDIDIAKTIEIINWTIQGFGDRHRELSKGLRIEAIEIETVVGEMDEYFVLMKRCFYREAEEEERK